jgi:Fe-S cluster biogenesis protein NfuA
VDAARLAVSTAPEGAPVEEQIQKVIEAIRPAVQADNGDIFLRSVDPETGVVEVELVGACVTCPASTVTLKAGVERILKDRVEGVTEVRNIGETFVESSVSL